MVRWLRGRAPFPGLSDPMARANICLSFTRFHSPGRAGSQPIGLAIFLPLGWLVKREGRGRGGEVGKWLHKGKGGKAFQGMHAWEERSSLQRSPHTTTTVNGRGALRVFRWARLQGAILLLLLLLLFLLLLLEHKYCFACTLFCIRVYERERERARDSWYIEHLKTRSLQPQRSNKTMYNNNIIITTTAAQETH